MRLVACLIVALAFFALLEKPIKRHATFFYIGTILGYVILGKGSLIDAISLKSIKHIKDIIYN